MIDTYGPYRSGVAQGRFPTSFLWKQKLVTLRRQNAPKTGIFAAGRGVITEIWTRGLVRHHHAFPKTPMQSENPPRPARVRCGVSRSPLQGTAGVRKHESAQSLRSYKSEILGHTAVLHCRHPRVLDRVLKLVPAGHLTGNGRPRIQFGGTPRSCCRRRVSSHSGN